MSQRILKSNLVRNLYSSFRNAKKTNAPTSQLQRRSLAYASVNHADAYKHAMEGRHGQQLKLAYEEGAKYESKLFDPFDAYKVETEDDEDNEMMVEINDNQVEIADERGEGEEADDDDDLLEEEIDELAEPTKPNYNKDGSLNRTKAELVSLNAGAPAGGNFAIINLDGSQHKVTADDVVILNKLRPVEKWAVGTTHTLTAEEGQMLLMGNQEQTLVGLPYVNGGEVDVMVEEITRDKKVIVFKKKRRKNYRKKNGHKREVTFLRVLDIRFPQNA